MTQDDFMYWCVHCTKGTNHYPTYLVHMSEVHQINVQNGEPNEQHPG